MIGRRLSHYDIVDEISRGGMGVVYRGVDVNLGREVAIKVLPDDLIEDPDRRARLLHEARAASSLEHPHIAVIHEVGEADDVTFVAMELIRGEKLSDLIARGPLAPARALTLAAEIAEGLSRAHEKGIVHRDLKPANVMITDDGHAKIIDFGLAKVLAPLTSTGSTVSVATPLTRDGTILGTAAYMSPEQARGARIDHRTDIFALGVTLYEMVTGRPAYQGRSTLDTLQAILTQPVPPLPATSDSLAETTAEVQRIIGKCTAKEPDERYQGMKDLVVDLRAARRRSESSEELPDVNRASRPLSTARPPVRWMRFALAAATGVIVIAAATFWWTRQRPPAAIAPSGKPAVAVLYFENNTGDASLDWMRTGLTDMLVTNLSQSPDFEVLGTDRLVEILQDLRRANDRVVSADVVREIADRARVENVLVGSYVRAGGTIRISARLQEARSGRIVSAERVEGVGDSALFQLVDELTRRFVSSMKTMAGGPPPALLPKPAAEAERGLDRVLSEITTSSIDAYRYYAEGITLHERNLSAQAAPLLQKAVEIDPDFAMAYAKLAVVAHNMGRQIERDEYARQALQRIDRLTTRERYYIEGFYYTLRPDTMAKGIEAYKRGLELHPEHQASRHNLALMYMQLERFEEGIAQATEMLRRGTSNATSYENLIEMLVRTGNIPRAQQVAEELMRLKPDSAAALRARGAVEMIAGRLDDARASFEKSIAIDPLDFGAPSGSMFVAMLQERWDDARAVGDDMLRSVNPFQRFLALANLAQVDLARGRGNAAREILDRALRIEGLAPQPRAAGRNRIVGMLLRSGRYAEAMAQAELALRDAERRDAEFGSLELLGIAQAAMGRYADAEKTIERLTARATVQPSGRDQRRIHSARGELAMRKGDVTTGLKELMQAQSLLPPSGAPLGPPTTHMDYWLAAANANIAAGNDAEAIRLLERLQGHPNRVFNMEPWARSFFLLGRLYERRGEREEAHRQFKRFVELWGDGDLQRDWVQEARQKLAR